MKLSSYFKSFLTDTVNLNSTRIGLLDSSIDAIKNFIRQSEWTPRNRSFFEHGSWAHDTIIKPVDQGEFDADLLVIVDHVQGWSASDYVTTLSKIFGDSATYSKISKKWDYCVTVTYSGERKVDIAPCVRGRNGDGLLEVCNGKTNEFVRTEPVKFTDWLVERNSISRSNSFRKVTRLIKYLRDIKTTFTCSSVLLTTLLGRQIDTLDKDSELFADTPTALKTIIGRLDDFLQGYSKKPKIVNPYLWGEDFAATWTDDQYTNFRNFVHKYREWIDAAFDSPDRADSITLWRKVFGNDFAKSSEIVAKSFLSEDAFSVHSLLRSSAAHLDDLVETIREYGTSILPNIFNKPPHMRLPPWPRASTWSFPISVVSIFHTSKDGINGTPVRSGQILRPRGGLWFDVKLRDGRSIPDGHRVQWRITNTGAIAMALGKGRGGFEVPQRGNRRWEALEYRGVHIAEAFVIRMSDDVLVAQSDPYHVTIE
ncbi:SMODS domain-containing nucleotidyltransferase [Mesorhizobium escarrei]|uniref:AGS_C domain-containing protein n=1 Tax=Mesorhizobium escarrei TaxID=666018 RepID=A0ABN8KGF4_9HYPH|nr:nucleotidyltransferase [Mesorhizobium escarrei]CAH2409369.1 AGS_C domain-containing protein [Mesorhizobium escarrei]